MLIGDRVTRIAMGHLMSPEYKGNLLDYIQEREKEDNDKIVKAVSSWMNVLSAVKSTLDDFLKDTDFNVERRGGNFYFHPRKENFKESQSYPMIFVLPNGDTFISDASHKEREHEEENSKKRTPQHEPPMGAKKHTMVEGVQEIIDMLKDKKTKMRYNQ